MRAWIGAQHAQYIKTAQNSASRQFLSSYDQECQHFQEWILPRTLNPEVCKPRNPLWYNHLERAQTHVNLVRRSRTLQNQYARTGPSHQELFLSCQEQHKTYTRTIFYFMQSLPFPSPLVDWSLSDWISKPVRIQRHASATNITHLATLWKAISSIVHVSPTQRNCFLHTLVALWKAISKIVQCKSYLETLFLAYSSIPLKGNLSRVIHVSSI